ncbi:MAG: hypothetical protein HY329_08580 [Chloroflexi bacterium]|nr:hypothetical protein [Chloroflexota bacterium]
MNGFTFLDPTPEVKAEASQAVGRRLSELAGRRIGLFDNSKNQGDVILERVGELLRERYGVATVVPFRKPNYSDPAADELLDQIAAEVEGVVFAIAA